MNELIFLGHSALIGIFTLCALAMSKEALIALICLLGVLSNLFVVKQTTLFGYNATCADAFTIGAVLGLNLLQEYYGRQITQKAIWLSFGALIAFTLLGQIHLLYLPSLFDETHALFVSILAVMPRITLASLVVFLVVQQVDCHLFALLKNRWQDKHLLIRYWSSILLCQLLDTILFSFLGLYGILDNIFQIIVISYIIKVLAIVVSSPAVAFSRYIVTRLQDTYGKPV